LIALKGSVFAKFATTPIDVQNVVNAATTAIPTKLSNNVGALIFNTDTKVLSYDMDGSGERRL
jgi:hypothetical protein